VSPPRGAPAALAEYAEQLLAGTGVSAEQALRIAQATDDPDTTLAPTLVAALRAGWVTPELAERADRPDTTVEEP
jgi:hypothetical protein